jgi:hypothetical protein
VRPLTTIVLPNESGFQIGGTSLAGMKGPVGGVSPVNARLAGKKIEPSRLKERS